MPSHLDSIFGSIFHRFLPPTSIPWTLKIIVFPLGKTRFLQKIAFRSWHRLLFDFSANMPPFFFQKSTNILPKIDYKMNLIFDRFFHQFFSDFGSGGLLGASWAVSEASWRPRPTRNEGELFFGGLLGPSWPHFWNVFGWFFEWIHFTFLILSYKTSTCRKATKRLFL